MAQNFIAVTAAPSTEVAMYWLEAGNFNMESAIELYFSTSALPMPPGGNSGGNFDTSAAELGFRNENDMNVDDPSVTSGTPPEFIFDNNIYPYRKEDEVEVIRRPDTVKKQRLMSEQSDQYLLMARKAVLNQNLPVRYVYNFINMKYNCKYNYAFSSIYLSNVFIFTTKFTFVFTSVFVLILVFIFMFTFDGFYTLYYRNKI